jgi:hypothetical protein
VRRVRSIFLLALFAGLGITLLEASRSVAPVAIVPTQYGTNTPTGIGNSIYPIQSLLIAGHGTGGLGAGPLAGIVIAGVVVLVAITLVVLLVLRRG